MAISNGTSEMKKQISVATEHIFPVIKKWLYSEKEIFLRELVSNACDAVTKLRRLEGLAQFTLPEGESYRVDVALDEEENTLTISDNGIGMTKDEVEKYICQIALSGALDFIEKYEGGEGEKNGIIGHFGLGFYSAFMVAERVEIRTTSYQGGETTLWSCTENGEYEYLPCDEPRGRGTDVILHLGEEGKEYASKAKLREILTKYCAFMPVEIFLSAVGEAPETDESGEVKPAEQAEPVNDTAPLWLKNPSDCTEEEYKKFYSDLFRDWREPLFQIHISADYPLNFKGILYFPKIASEYESLEGQVKLYYNQVFVADNIKEVIPEYLLMLRGVLDCPELPLNVSRSYLQNSGYVAKISAHIVKKVADKLCSMAKNERERFEGLWRDLKLFVEYGALRDRKFYDRVKDCVLLEKVGGGFCTPDEYIESVKELCEGKIYYATDPVTQAQYIALFEGQGIPVVLLDKVIDSQFIGILEESKSVKFLRVDAEAAEALKGDGEEFSDESAEPLLKKVSRLDSLKVEFAVLKDAEIPAVLNVNEESRRVADMMKMYSPDGKGGDFPTEMTLILNSASPLVRKLFACEDGEKKERAAAQLWSLSLLAQRQLTAEELRNFLKQSYRTVEESL